MEMFLLVAFLVIIVLPILTLALMPILMGLLYMIESALPNRYKNK